MPRTWPRPPEIPFGTLSYRTTPVLVHMVTYAHHAAGLVDGRRLSYYGETRLQLQAKTRRIMRMVHPARAADAGPSTAGTVRLDVDEKQIQHVLAGDRLPPKERKVQDRIRACSVLCDAVQERTGSGWAGPASSPAGVGRASTAADAHAYLDFSAKGAPNWASYSGQSRAALLSSHQPERPVPESIVRLYAWLAADPLLAEFGLLRAVALYWGLSLTEAAPMAHAGIDAVVDHELRVAGLGGKGLLVLNDHRQGIDVLRLDGYALNHSDFTGDLTGLFEEFARAVGHCLGAVHKQLATFQDGEDRLPWIQTRLPDQLDRAIFDVIEKHGTITSQTLLERLAEPPPLRTLQRRLHGLATEGLIVRLGGRKNATYRLAERV